VYQKLYLERWLLLLKNETVARGLDAHLRALDYKGGKWLAFAVGERSGRGHGWRVEFRYRKRLTGPAMAAAATDADSAERVRGIHEAVLDNHRGLLENGLRRFLRRSIRLLQALSDAFRSDAGLAARLEAGLREIDFALRQAKGGPMEARPAAAARRAGRGYEMLPAACLSTRKGPRLIAIQAGRPLELAALVPRPAKRSSRVQQDAADEPSWTLDLAGDMGIETLGEWGTELLGAGEGRAPALPGADPAGADLAGADLAGADLAGAVGDVEVGALADLGGAAEAGAGLAEGAAEAAGTAAEAIATSGSALADASCSGVDCGAVDCGGIDCIPG
jgi:hypothetical protein